MTRFCPSCGTEVDRSALFCPSCGRALGAADEPSAATDQAPRASSAAAAAPPAPAATPAASAAAPAPPVPPAPTPRTPEAELDEADAGRTEAHPRAAPSPPDEPPPVAAGATAHRDRQMEIPVTWPTTLSGWLIGIGVVLGALGLLIGFVDRAFNPIDVLLLPALLIVAATVFFSATIPRVPHLALAILAIALVAFGIGLDRIGFGGAGMGELLLFLGAAAASIGAIVLAVGHDQPLGGRGS